MADKNPQSHQPSGKPPKNFWPLFVEAGFEFAFLIAVPLIAFVLLGKWLDTKYHKNFFQLLGIFAGLAVSCMSVWKRIKDYKNLLK